LPKFLLVDPNITDSGGHYLQYAEQILEVAARRGFECHLGANRAFGDQNPDRAYSVHSVFLLDMFGRNHSQRQASPNRLTDIDRRYLRDYYSLAGLVWNASKALEVTRHYARHTTLPSSFARRLVDVHRIRTRVESLLQATDESADVGYADLDERALRYHRFRAALQRAGQGDHRSEPEFETLAEILRLSRAADGYGASLSRLVNHLELGAADHVFIPTLSLSEARAIRDLLRKDQRAQRPRWSLLFRRDVFEGYSVDWPKQDWASHEARNLFASFMPLLDRVKISFFTDTNRLTAQYEQLGSVPFRTTAVPVRAAKPSTRELVGASIARLLVLCSVDISTNLVCFAELLESLSPKDLQKVHFLLPAWKDENDTDNQTDLELRLAMARLRPYLGDVVTLLEPGQDVRNHVSSVDACLLIDTGPHLSPDSLEWARLIQNVPVLAIDDTSSGAGFSTEEVSVYLAGVVRNFLAHFEPRRSLSNSVVVGFVGDARAEKNFHLLPQIVNALLSDSSGGCNFALNAQVYHPNPESDIRMLLAMEQIGKLPADRADRKGGALGSEEYLEIVGRSDIIYNVYARHNYISRSSGIFVEALASKKPVITISGTWMSGLFGEWSQSYHDDKLAGGQRLREQTLVNSSDWSFLGDYPCPKGDYSRLTLLPRMSAVHTDAIPPEANHLRFEVCTGSPNPDAPLCVIIAWQGSDRITFTEIQRQLNRATAGAVSLVLPVPAGARNLWLGLSLSHHLQQCPIEWAKISWHVTDYPVAEMPGGIAIPDGDDAKLT